MFFQKFEILEIEYNIVDIEIKMTHAVAVPVNADQIKSIAFYEELVSKVQDSKNSDPIGPEEMKRLCLAINNLSDTYFEYLYVLILNYYLLQMRKNEKLEKVKLPPYDAKVFDSSNKKGLIYIVSNLPDELQKIIQKYVEYVSSII